MAKIFLSFYNGIQHEEAPNAIPLFYEAFCDGLKQYGNEVFAVVHKNWMGEWGEIPAKVLKEIKDFNPDLIILFNNAFYDLSKDFDCPIVIYSVDSPLCYQNKEALIHNPSRYTFFELQDTSVSDLQQNFHVPAQNIHILPFFSSIKAKKEKLKRNICFIGTKFTQSNKSCINDFLETKPSEEERRNYLNLLNKIQNNPFITQDELLQDIAFEKIKSHFKKSSIVFILSDYLRTQVLNAVADLGLEIWGTSNWGTDNYSLPYINLCYNHTPVYSVQHNQDIYNSSKIGISIGHLQAKEGFPWRILDIMASNACLVTDYHANFKKYFPELSLPCYETPYEARELCIRLLKDETYRQDIVLQSQEIVNKNYRFINVLQKIQDYLKLSLINQAEGKLHLSNLDSYDRAISKNQGLFDPWEVSAFMKFKNNLRYKLWKHLDKKLRRKGIIQ